MHKLALTFLLTASPAAAEEIVFIGSPQFRLQHGGTSEGRIERSGFTHSEKLEWACVVIREHGRYFWRSRENKELGVSQSGEYITFSPVDGSPDYVRIRIPVPSDPKVETLVRSAQSPFEYTEHLTLGLTTISYWGDIAKFDSARIPYDRDMILFRKRQ